ncbi:MAG: hypothetical protein E3J94_07120 [Desulfobacteraceae bacterium]|nr:MAG: hypothetical protein E3J94_07120 [Desulfobacteraceae bacterium]
MPIVSIPQRNIVVKFPYNMTDEEIQRIIEEEILPFPSPEVAEAAPKLSTDPEPSLYEKAKRVFRGEKPIKGEIKVPVEAGDPELTDPAKFPQPTGPEDYPPGTFDEYGKPITAVGPTKTFGISETGEAIPERRLPDPGITDIPAPPITDIYPQGPRAGPLPAGIGYLQKPIETALDFWNQYLMSPGEEKEMRSKYPNLMAARYAAASLFIPGLGEKLASPMELETFQRLPFEEQQNRIIGLAAGYISFGAGTELAKQLALKAALKYPWLTKPRKGPIKTLFESNWYRRLKVKERGLLVQNIDVMIKGMETRGMSEAQILRALQRHDLTDAAYKRFAKAQKIEPEAEVIIPPEPPKKPVEVKPTAKPAEVVPKEPVKPPIKPSAPPTATIAPEAIPVDMSRIYSVAIKLDDGKIYKGVPGEIHKDIVDRVPKDKFGKMYSNLQYDNMGYIGYDGKFYTRKEASKLPPITPERNPFPEKKKPGKAYKPIKQKEEKVLTLRGAIRNMGNLKPIRLSSGKISMEMKDISRFLFARVTKGQQRMPFDLAEEQLKRDGWLNPDEELQTVLKDPANFTRNKVVFEGKEKPEHLKTEKEKRVDKQAAWEPEAPPEGEYVTIKAEDLPEGAKLTLIEDKSTTGWDIYEVSGKDPFEITIEDGDVIKLKPLDKIQVLKKDLVAARPAEIPEEAQAEALDIYLEGKKKPEIKEVEKELGARIDKIAKDETQRGSLERPAPGAKPSKEPAKPFRFTSLRKEAQFKASQGVQKPSLMKRVTETFTSLAQKASREFEHIPKTKEFAELRVALLRLAKQKGVASDRTKRVLQGITIDLNKNNYDLFSRKVIMDDLAATKDEGKLVPTWFSDKEYLRVNEAVKQNTTIQAAIEKRDRFWSALKSDYIEAMKAIGFDVSKKVSRDSYFRHQVLDYINIKGIFGVGRKLKTPRARGFLKKRIGSELEINTDYLQAEHEVMAQMLYDIEVANTIRKVDVEYNIIDSLKKKAIKKRKETEDPDISWEDFIPDDYSAWQPSDGNVFYMADSIPAKIAVQIEKGLLEEFGITKDHLRKVLAVGLKRRQFVLKDEIIATLDNMVRLRSENPFLEAQRTLINKWKQWQLISPRRLFKYNIRNLTGDAEAVFVGNPSGFERIPHALKELYDVFVNKKTMPTNMQDWFERGGMQSTLQTQEMGDINTLKIFIQLHAKGKKISEIPKTAWNQYWKTARLSTDFREATLRYANYLDYLDQINSSKNGLPKNYGASIPEEIKGIKNPKDKAFMLSNDLVGAYDRISVAGQTFREHVYPFWSFQEINMRRYFRLFKNAANNDRLAEAIGRKALGSAVKSTFTTIRVGKLLIKVTAFWVGLQIYNHLVFPEEEKELSQHVRNRPHIILGRGKDGKIDYFSRIGILGDFLEWFGLDIAPKYIDALMTGKMTPKEIALDMAESPINKTVQGMFPFIKVGAEVITRKALFPDVFKPRVIRDRIFHLARSFAMEEEFKAVFDRPSRPYKTTIKKFFIYSQDPNQAAYSEIFEEKRRFLKKIGKYGEGYWITPRGDALYNIRLSLKYDDKDSAKKYLQEYILAGGNIKGLERSLSNLDPLHGMNKDEKMVFVEYLKKTGETKKIKGIDVPTLLARAYKHYFDILTLEEKGK